MSAMTFVPAWAYGIDHIADHLREPDRVEVMITSPDFTVREIVRRSVADSRWSIIACVDGVPAIIYGVAPTPDPYIGAPWMLATSDIHKVRREFLTRCRDEVRLMQQKFAVLTNQVHYQNTLSIRWLEWLGFTIDRERPVGPNEELFVFWKGAARRV